MKIAILGFTHPNYMPYLYYYLDMLNEVFNIDISVIFWNRNNLPYDGLPSKVNKFEFRYNMSDNIPLTRKLPGIFKYRKHLINTLDANDFDLLIVLHTTTAMVISKKLTSLYNKKYIFDYRDVTYEKIGLYKKIVNGIITKSIITLTSSPGYMHNFNNQSNICLTNNISRFKITNCAKKSSRIRIRFWGFIRQVNTNIKIIDLVSRDQRFELHYHGREQEDVHKLKEYVIVKSIKNVFFHGEYNNNDRGLFAEDTDIIHNYYDADKTMRYAMSNKFYDALVLEKPQLANIESYMGNIVKSEEIGYTFNLNDCESLDDLLEYYNRLNFGILSQKCKILLEKYEAQNVETKKVIARVLKENIYVKE